MSKSGEYRVTLGQPYLIPRWYIQKWFGFERFGIWRNVAWYYDILDAEEAIDVLRRSGEVSP